MLLSGSSPVDSSGYGEDYSYDYEYYDYESSQYAEAENAASQYEADLAEASAAIAEPTEETEHTAVEEEYAYDSSYYDYDYAEIDDASYDFEEYHDYSEYDEAFETTAESTSEPETIPPESSTSTSADGSTSETSLTAETGEVSTTDATPVFSPIELDFRDAVAAAVSQYNSDTIDAEIEFESRLTDATAIFDGAIVRLGEEYADRLTSEFASANSKADAAQVSHETSLENAKATHAQRKQAIAKDYSEKLTRIEAAYDAAVKKAEAAAAEASTKATTEYLDKRRDRLRVGAAALAALDEQYEIDRGVILDRYAIFFSLLHDEFPDQPSVTIEVSPEVYAARHDEWSALNAMKYEELAVKQAEYGATVHQAALVYRDSMLAVIESQQIETIETEHTQKINAASAEADAATAVAVAENEAEIDAAFSTYLSTLDANSAAAAAAASAALATRDLAIAELQADFTGKTAIRQAAKLNQLSWFAAVHEEETNTQRNAFEQAVHELANSLPVDAEGKISRIELAWGIVGQQRQYRDNVASSQALEAISRANEIAAEQSELYDAAASTLRAIATVEADYQRSLNQINATQRSSNSQAENTFVNAVAAADSKYAENAIKIANALSGKLVSADKERLESIISANDAIGKVDIEATETFEKAKIRAEAEYERKKAKVFASYVPLEHALSDKHWEVDKLQISDARTREYAEKSRDLARRKNTELGDLSKSHAAAELEIVTQVALDIEGYNKDRAEKVRVATIEQERAVLVAAVTAAEAKVSAAKLAAEAGVPINETLITSGAGSLHSYQVDVIEIQRSVDDAQASAEETWTKEAIEAEKERQQAIIDAAKAKAHAEAQARKRAAWAEHAAAERAERDLSYVQGVGQVFRGFGDALYATIEGGYFMVRHPVQTVNGIAHAITHPVDTTNLIINDYAEKSKTLRGQGEIVGEILIEVATGGTAAANGVPAKVCLFRCFTGETEVATPDGPRRIDSIQVGDQVLAQDFETGQWVPREVLATHENAFEGALVTVETEGSDGEEPATFTATEAHPIWVVSGHELDKRPACDVLAERESEGLALPGRWVYSHDLRPGDRLASETGEPKRVTKITQEWSHADGPKVYNLTIAGLPSYAVGTARILAHNVSACNLRAELGLVRGDGFDAHHLIPQESTKQFPELLERARKGGFEMHDSKNGLAVERGLHQDVLHPGGYNEMVFDELDRLTDHADALTDTMIANRLYEMADQLRGFINTLEVVE